jgi:hypothetical protein
MRLNIKLNGEQNINVSVPATLPDGLYLLKIETATGVLQAKLNLQR